MHSYNLVQSANDNFFPLIPTCCHQVPSKPSTESVSSPEDVFPLSPTLVRKQAMRDKVLRSGAYRSFTCTPVKQRHLQERLNAPQGGTGVQRTLSKVKEFLR